MITFSEGVKAFLGKEIRSKIEGFRSILSEMVT